ncbi:MAG: Chromosomal replication initiator protein DnaA [Chlamydiae bacterium]|nr:Chromosomal replication initiator protein DnaA [Chlamydiota bacterium]
MRAWEEFLALQEKELGKETVAKWLRPLKVVRFDACNLYLEANDSFKTIWFEEHMRPRVKSRLLNNNNKQIRVHISVANQKKLERKKKSQPFPISSAFKLTFDEINPESKLDNFVTSQNNLLAFKLLKESCERDKLSLNFNPIYLFGRPGSGKTHLMMAAANQLKANGQSVIYVRADTFTEHVVSAIRGGEMQTFRKTYRKTDALLIDDIEIFSKKGATQEELFHTFNTLHTEGKQIILSAHSPPQELRAIAARLVSRFEWGIVIPLQMLEKEEMRQVLVEKAKKVNFALQDKVADFLLDTFGNNTKNLTRALEALILRSHLNQGIGKPANQPLTLSTAKHYLTDLILEEEKAVLTPGKIIRTVAEFYGIRIEDILSKSQSRECALPRQIAMHLCRRKLNLPYMKIGDIFARDHSTVMSSVKQVQKDVDGKNLELSSSVNRIIKRLEIS